MNIIVRTYGGNIIVRPDTTWSRNNDDYFVPDFVDSISWSPVLCVRISRLGKHIAERFAPRYYDGCGKGILLYPENLMDGSEESYACASILDRTSCIVLPEGDLSALTADEKSLVDSALAQASRLCRVRAGDILAVELAAREPLCSRGEGKYRVSKEGASFDILF